MAKTMSALIADIKRAEASLVRKVKPLNQRLKALNMHVYWEGEYKEWFINRFSADSKSGMSFWLDGRKYKKLMAMSDGQLLDYCQNWGKS